VGASNGDHIIGTLVPVEEPSTASGAEHAVQRNSTYSITSSASICIEIGTSIPSALVITATINEFYRQVMKRQDELLAAESA
jgi:hypothetical protein